MSIISPQKDVSCSTQVKKDETVYVTLRKNEVIEFLKMLEGIKRTLQKLLKPDI
jgi:hypothetical protein